MSFLKKLGLGIVKGLEIAARFEGVLGDQPRVQSAVQRVESELEQLSTIVVQVEAVGAALSLPGADKLTAATPLVAQALLSSPLLLGKKVQNAALFQKAAQEYAQATVDLLNSLEASATTNT